MTHSFFDAAKVQTSLDIHKFENTFLHFHVQTDEE